ncbi:GNAT family N-acetyltransferase [Psychrobacter phenylpyruvicus]|uniref:Putative acetyltransferase n=1 Tax=Psychrobacter phenylpyruvicus TaxID=29432 RepID=A0A379LP25_9GAMM|nr:GNAT family N-acetyltransferase [Psychrobacter phenylpyruvicus]SUD92298.1 putative acetyltransferase [Psychrobacter phenylpyruvicus]
MIEAAKEADAHQIAKVIQASIKSCVTDHQNDPVAINQWLANKTESNIKHWIKHNSAWVFKQDSEVQGVILVSAEGEILLNYVTPDSQGQGIGRALLDRVKQQYQSRGITTLVSESTLTAKRFYLANDFQCVEEVYEPVEQDHKHSERLIAYKMKAIL